MKTSNMSDYEEISSNESFEEISDNDSEEKIFLSNEGNKNKSIIDFTEIDSYKKAYNNYSLFDKKKVAEKLCKNFSKESEYSIDDLLFLDETNKTIQNYHMQFAIEKLNSNQMDESQREILIEKIRKAGIVMDENEYNENIKRIKDEEIKKTVSYINYKKSLINALEYILKNRNKKFAECAKRKLELKTIFKFNQFSEMKENNYYFYRICLELFDKIDEIYEKYFLYTTLVTKMLAFLKTENFNDLTDNKKHKFRYISQIILDRRALKNKNQLEEILNYLDGNPVKENDIINSLKNMKIDQTSPYTNYKLKYRKKQLKLIIKETKRINKTNYSYATINSYNISSFNDKILNLIESNFDSNFESDLFLHILPNYENQTEFYQNLKPIIENIIRRILNSKSAENFFNDHYGKKYKDLVYHFNREDVQNEIFRRIYFAPIFNRDDKAYTDPIDMTITINALPGKIDDINYCFNRKVLHVGRILVFYLHEIFGHFLRRYYSYFTGIKIAFDTKDDDVIDTGEESGFYIERTFLGLKFNSYIGLNNILSLLNPSFYFNYPIIKEDKHKFDQNALRDIIKENRELFDFIIEKEEKEKELQKEKEEKEKEKGKGKKTFLKKKRGPPKIVFEDYLDSIQPSTEKQEKIHCFIAESDSICLDNYYSFRNF